MKGKKTPLNSIALLYIFLKDNWNMKHLTLQFANAAEWCLLRRCCYVLQPNNDSQLFQLAWRSQREQRVASAINQMELQTRRHASI